MGRKVCCRFQDGMVSVEKDVGFNHRQFVDVVSYISLTPAFDYGLWFDVNCCERHRAGAGSLSRNVRESMYKDVPIRVFPDWKPFPEGVAQPDSVVACVNKCGGIIYLVDTETQALVTTFDSIKEYFMSRVEAKRLLVPVFLERPNAPWNF